MDELLRSFASDSSFVGLYGLASGSFRRRMLWTILLLFGVGFMSYQIQDRVSYYLSWPTEVEYRMRNSKSLRFPTVTVCSETVVSRKYTEVLGEKVQKEIEKSFSPLHSIHQPNAETDSIRNISSNGSWESFYMEYSQKMPDLLLQCEFTKESCDWSETLSPIMTDLGYCFAFNPGTANLETSQPGSLQGLRLVLYYNQSDTLVPNAPSAGFRIILHDKDETPFINELGLKVTPGKTTSINFTFKNVSQLPAPYGDCEDKANYTYMKCMRKCFAHFLIDNCKCVIMQFQKDDDSAPVCSPEQHTLCGQMMSPLFVSSGAVARCRCPLQCNRRSYPSSISTSSLSQHFVKYTSTQFSKFKGRNVTPSKMSREITILELFFSQLTYVDIQTIPAYNAFHLFCDIGGALGLILGASVLSVCEVLQLFVEIAIHFYGRK